MIDRRAWMLRSAAAIAGLAAGTPAWLHAARRSRGDELDRLAGRIEGVLLRPGDPAYERARQVVAAKADPHPLAIVRPSSAEDVQRVVDHARSRGLPLAVKGGGHSNPGFGVGDGALTLDMSGLVGVSVDPRRRSALVGGGSRVRQVDQATAPYALAAPLGECPTVGIAGYALGGGFGLLAAPFGLGCDSIRAAEVVLADGRRLWTDAEREPDLFWALRGGGGNFGVVTRLELRLNPVGEVLAGQLHFDADARAGLLAYRDFVATAPASVTSIGRIVQGQAGKPVFAVRLCDVAPGSAHPALAALRRASGLTRDRLKPTSYAALQAQAPDEYAPVLDETRAGFLPDLPDRLIAAMLAAASSAPCEFEIRLAHLHGTAARVPAGARAFPIGTPGLDCWVSAEWQGRDGEAAALGWLEECWRTIEPFTRGAYVNGLDRDGPARIRGAYLGAYRRLSLLKRRYDPDNMFRFNHNIEPAQERERSPG